MSKAALGKHWYNNGVEEGYFIECPEGWVKGRLPISDATRKKQSENSGMRKMTPEQKQIWLDKRRIFNENESLEHKKHKSEAISKSTKGKHLGKTPWNKGKKGMQKAWNKGIKTGKPSWNTGVKMSYKAKEKMSKAHKGKTPWNKGQKYQLSEEVKASMLQKEYETKRLNNSFNTSSPEEIYYNFLCEKYFKEDVIRQYKDERYPFQCDFYIKSEDLFIELNLKKDRSKSFGKGKQKRIELYGLDNLTNWKKGQRTRINNSGSLEESYRQGYENQIQTMLDIYNVKCSFLKDGVSGKKNILSLMNSLQDC